MYNHGRRNEPIHELPVSMKLFSCLSRLKMTILGKFPVCLIHYVSKRLMDLRPFALKVHVL